MNRPIRPNAGELRELRQTASEYDGGELPALSTFARTGKVMEGLTDEVNDCLAHVIVFGGTDATRAQRRIARLHRLREHAVVAESALSRDRRLPGVQPGAGHARSNGTGEPTLPFLRAIEYPASDKPSQSADSTPPGWIAEAAGRWAGQAVEVVYDPRRHAVMFTSSSSSTNSEVVRLLEAGGWERRATGGNRTFWTQDRLAATRAALARLDQSASGAERERPEHTVEAPSTAARPAAGQTSAVASEVGADHRSKAPVYAVGQRVRWKQRGRWRQGRIGDPPVERDGSLHVFDDFNGGSRALRPAGVQRLARGPRGGRRWVPCEPADNLPQPDRPPVPVAQGGVHQAGRPVGAARTAASRRFDPPTRPSPGLGL
jgi:hypothetical protein